MIDAEEAETRDCEVRNKGEKQIDNPDFIQGKGNVIPRGLVTLEKKLIEKMKGRRKSKIIILLIPPNIRR